MMMDGALNEIATEFVDFLKVARVELDRNPNLGLWYGVRCLPTVLYFSGGEVRVGIFGTTNKDAILSQLRPVMNNRVIGPINSKCMTKMPFRRNAINGRGHGS